MTNQLFRGNCIDDTFQILRKRTTGLFGLLAYFGAALFAGLYLISNTRGLLFLFGKKMQPFKIEPALFGSTGTSMQGTCILINIGQPEDSLWQDDLMSHKLPVLHVRDFHTGTVTVYKR